MGVFFVFLRQIREDVLDTEVQVGFPAEVAGFETLY